MNFVKKVACLEKKRFLSETCNFFNTKAVRKLINEKKIICKEKCTSEPNRKERYNYEIKGERRGILGKMAFTRIPPSLIPKPPRTDSDTFENLHSYLKPAKSSFNIENGKLWIVEFFLTENMPELFILLLEHFLLTRNKRMRVS